MIKKPIKTKKYVIYVNGDIYRVGESRIFTKIYSEDNLDFLAELKGKEIDELVEQGEGAIEKKKSSNLRENFKENPENLIIDCQHMYMFLENLENEYIFACKKCLELRMVKK